jgi:glycogen phosphorylase
MSAPLQKIRASGSSVTSIREGLLYALTAQIGTTAALATRQDWLHAISLVVREQVAPRLVETRQRHEGARSVSYLSMEFLMGRSLDNNLINLDLREAMEFALKELGRDYETLREEETDAALGNGGLGRLAACFLDSLATLNLPATGYGLQYEFGLFRQEIDNHQQREYPDTWNPHRSPWLIERHEESVFVPVYGQIHHTEAIDGGYNPMWMDWKLIVGVPSDMPIVGFGGRTVNALRLYTAKGAREFDMKIFSEGDYVAAVEHNLSVERISKVLYPADHTASGKELRLLQEYFLVACAVRDITRRHLRTHGSIDTLAEFNAVQLNDTHPALAVVELMRLLLDEHALGWDAAFEQTRKICGYTNHTLLSEALEKWPVALLERVLPRHLQIIYELNRRFLAEVEARWPGQPDRLQRMSLIEEGDHKQVRMANLSIVGSHSVNGVAALHSDLVKTNLVPDFFELWPERFNNKTNGITQRRWLNQCNKPLASLITGAIGGAWVKDLSALKELKRYQRDVTFLATLGKIKQANKVKLAALARDLTGVKLNPDALFDVQIKRVHEYKRQLLNIMHVIHLYMRIKHDDYRPPIARAVIMAGKAAPGYHLAKQIIHLGNRVGELINKDPLVSRHLQFAWLPDYRVSLAEQIVPAADLSEQISTAGKEASGTGNMKLSLNGALTIGTLDGANIEIMEEVGKDNIFIFGLTTAEVSELRPHYDPRERYRANLRIKRVVDAIADGTFSGGDRETFSAIVHRLMNGDEYMHLADFESYVGSQDKVAQTFARPERWNQMALLNIASMGKFSSDRTIAEYNKDIWSLTSIP